MDRITIEEMVKLCSAEDRDNKVKDLLKQYNKEEPKGQLAIYGLIGQLLELYQGELSE